MASVNSDTRAGLARCYLWPAHRRDGRGRPGRHLDGASSLLVLITDDTIDLTDTPATA